MKLKTKALIRSLLVDQIANLEWLISHHPITCEGDCVKDWKQRLLNIRHALADL